MVFGGQKNGVFYPVGNDLPTPASARLLRRLAIRVIILASLVNLFFRYWFRVSSDPTSEAISFQVAVILKEEREKRGLSLKMLARQSGISRQTISYIEQEVQSPSLDTLLLITSALGVDLAKISGKAQKRAAKKSPAPIRD